MRQIKFRGVTAYDGRTIYGDVIHEARLALIVHDNIREVVKPESVSQMVEVIDGKEIYEGDTIELNNKRYRAALRSSYNYEAD